MNDRKKNRPRGRPKVSGVCKLSKAVTVKFSKIDYERLCRRSRQANLTLAEFLRVSAFERIGGYRPGPRRKRQPSYAALRVWQTT